MDCDVGGEFLLLGGVFDVDVDVVCWLGCVCCSYVCCVFVYLFVGVICCVCVSVDWWLVDVGLVVWYFM